MLMNPTIVRILGALVLTLTVGLAGCARAPVAPQSSEPAQVPVGYPLERDVTDYADYTGRTVAVDSVEVRARVWGYLDKVNFKEGVLVEKGDVLFEIDPRTYKAALSEAEGKVAALEARLARLDADLARAKRLVNTAAIGR